MSATAPGMPSPTRNMPAAPGAGGKAADRTLMAGLFLLALAVCAAFIVLAGPLPLKDDALQYFRIAENVSRGRGFTEDGVLPHTYRPPLFSALLGAWFYITGSRTVLSAQIYQSLCLALSAVATFLLCLEVFPGRRAAAALSGLWLALHPSAWTLASWVVQEPTILLATTVAAWLTARWLAVPGWGKAAAAGAAWGVAALAKSVALFVPALLVLFRLICPRKSRPAPFREAALAAAVFLAVIAPWTARNYLVLHRLVPVNDQAAGMLEWNVGHSDVPAGEGRGPVALLATLLATRNAAPGELAGQKFLAGLDRAGLSGEARRERLWGYVAAHPGYFLVQRVRNAIFFAAPSVDWLIQTGRLGTGAAQRSAPFLAAAALLHLPLYGFLGWRLYGLFRGRLPLPLSFFVLFFLAYWGVYALMWGEPRFSVPVYPVLSLFVPWERLFPRDAAADRGETVGA